MGRTVWHHIRHWADGGNTNLDNGTLLRGRHHTIVHRDRLTALVTHAGVRWNRRLCSYDEAFARGAPTTEEPDSPRGESTSQGPAP
jgi:hypothetical protein